MSLGVLWIESGKDSLGMYPARWAGLWTCTPSGCSDDPVGVEFQSPARIAEEKLTRMPFAVLSRLGLSW